VSRPSRAVGIGKPVDVDMFCAFNWPTGGAYAKVSLSQPCITQEAG
jgi:hypothetical protein